MTAEPGADDEPGSHVSAPTARALSVPALSVHGVSRRFGEVTAVDDVSFDVAGSELVALVGPSGCGKSTLLRIIAGLIPTETGQVELAGVVVDDTHTSLPPERRQVGLVFQDHAVFPHLSVAANVGFGVRTGRGRRASRVAEMLDLVGLGGYAQRYPHELSGGERQRIALARALAPGPSLMLLDEPFASLDPNLRAQIRHDVVEILRSTATPAVFVTHDQGEALAIGDRIAVMSAGCIVQIDTPQHVFHAPVDRFVAAFMGEADFLSGDDLRTDLDLADVVGDVMARPDDIEFSVDPDGTAWVTALEFRGSAWSCTLQLASGATVRSTHSHIERVELGTTVSPRLVLGHRLVPITPIVP